MSELNQNIIYTRKHYYYDNTMRIKYTLCLKNVPFYSLNNSVVKKIPFQ